MLTPIAALAWFIIGFLTAVFILKGWSSVVAAIHGQLLTWRLGLIAWFIIGFLTAVFILS